VLAYIVRRIALAIPVLFALTVVTYALLSVAPGDPVSAMVDPEVALMLGPNWVEQQREALGLNDPLPVRYAIWLRELAQGNLGFSLVDRQAVTEKMGERIWPTFKLMSTALLIGLVVSIPLGIIAAVKQYSWIDYLSNVAGLAMISVPGFFVALGALYIFGVKLHWLPTAGMFTPGEPRSLGDSARHLILPATVLGLAEAASLIRYARSSMLEVIHQDFVVTARAEGLHERLILIRHALRNALIPLITIVALQLPSLLGGSVIIERIFAWPGLGTLAITAIFARDYPVIMAINLLGAVAIILSSLLADVLYAAVDPRVRYD
jgi:peptide/nickel transport system permease protein